MNEQLLMQAIKDEEKIRRNLNYSLNMLEIGAGLAAFVKDCSNQKKELSDKIELSKIKIEAMEKQIAMEIISIDNTYKKSERRVRCGSCNAVLSIEDKFCKRCGQKQGWFSKNG